MSVLVNHVRRSFYMDSVALMRLSRALSDLPGIEQAALMIGSATNKSLMLEAGLLDEEGRKAAANDLIMAIAGKDWQAVQDGLQRAQALLDQPAATGRPAGAWHPRSIEMAVQQLPGANLALISVPGEFATAEARKALRCGLHVMIFSDNVPIQDEIALKVEARDRGLLMMGPDCGTAIIAGTPLAFANVVPRGDIGIVAASGTGLQEVSCLLARNGHGVSHAIGVGGRDLKEEVGGIMTLMAIDALDGDPGTAAIVVISKPPAAAVAAKILERVAQSPKPFTICFLGAEAMELPANARQAGDLRSAAEAAMGGVAIEAPPGAVQASDIAHRISGAGRSIKGLFCGGTMCAEAQLVLRRAGLEVASNAPVPGARRAAAATEPGHVLLDLGEDEYTLGRPHPMIDPGLRDQMIGRAMSDPLTAVVLIDVVIGHGAHPDPAGEFAGLLGKAAPGSPVVIASVCGTEQDPQVYSRQMETLTKAGVIVAPSNAHATELAIAVLENIS